LIGPEISVAILGGCKDTRPKYQRSYNQKTTARTGEIGIYEISLHSFCIEMLFKISKVPEISYR
jgi:hypothetical protein